MNNDAREQAAVADLAQQPAGGVGGAFPLRGRGQQRGVTGDRTGDDCPDAVECLHGLGLGVGGPGTTSSQTGSLPSSNFSTASGGEHGVERVGVVVLAEPAVEDGVRLLRVNRCDRFAFGGSGVGGRRLGTSVPVAGAA